MALIVETGSGVSNANAYGVTDAATTLTACRTYAADRGIVLSATDSVVSSQLILATDYLESFSAQYVGAPASFTQSLSWPRQRVQFDPNNPYPSNVIPPQLLAAMYQAVIEQFNGIILQPSVDLAARGGFVIEDKVDVLVTKFSDRVGTTSQPLLPKVIALLSGLLTPIASLRTVRI